MDNTRSKREKELQDPEESYAWPPSDEVLQKIVSVDLTTGKLTSLDLDPIIEGTRAPSGLSEPQRPAPSPTSVAEDDSLFESSNNPGKITSEPGSAWNVPAALPDRTGEDATPPGPAVPPGLSPFELAHAQREGPGAPQVLPTAGHTSAATPPPAPRRTERDPASEARREPVVRPAIAPRPPSGGIPFGRWRELTRTQWLLAAVVVLALGEAVFIGWQMLGPGRSRTTAAAPSGESQPPRAAAPNTADQQASPPASSSSDSKGTTGQSSSVMIRSNPPGARVWIDGRPRGQTPLTVGQLSPGQHELILQGASGRVQQRIDLEPGGKATVMATLAGMVSGSIAVQSPTELQIMEGGKLVGSTRTEKILLNAGRHTLDLVSESLGYQARQVVDVTPGKTTVLVPKLPKGMLSANALPWAQVVIDGHEAGETPLGNVPLEIGSHEITFRHPELGEVKRTVTVTLRGPSRVSVDLQRPDK